VSGRNLNNTTPPVVPYLNIEKELGSNIPQMHSSLLLRNKSKNNSINIHEILKGSARLRCIYAEEENLNCRREEIKEIFKHNPNQLTVDDLKKEGRDIKKTLKLLRDERWEIEETALMQYIKLPNYLDKSIPENLEDEVLIEFRKVPEVEHKEFLKSHTELCSKDIEFSENVPSCYYLFGNVAKLEMVLTWTVEDFLLSKELEVCAGPDFARSAIVEGCNPDTDLYSDTAGKQSVFTLSPTSDFGDISSLAATHLVGSASLESLIGHYVKNIITNPGPALPKIYFCCGRKYSPITHSLNQRNSLYNVQQSTAIELICVAQSSTSLEEQFRYIELVIKEFYDKLGLHCRIANLHAGNIDHAAKSKVLSVMVYSPYLGQYVEVGNLNLYNDFISKRLMLLSEENNHLSGLHILSGTFMNVTNTIGSIIESCQIVGSKTDPSKVNENISIFLQKLSTI
jgi:seryl-tRNA synthetase